MKMKIKLRDILEFRTFFLISFFVMLMVASHELNKYEKIIEVLTLESHISDSIIVDLSETADSNYYLKSRNAYLEGIFDTKNVIYNKTW